MEQAQKHICGVCSDEWLTEEEYLAHVCPGTGFAPTEPEHQGPEFLAVQEAALARGEERREEEVHPAEAASTEVIEQPPVQ